MDSDSDLQAYINELSRKTQDLQYGDHESVSKNESDLSQSSSIEIVVKRNGNDNAGNIKQYSAKNSKVRELEEKYLKKIPKLSEQNFSLSFSDYNIEFEEEKLNTDNILTFPEEVTLDSSTKTKPYGNQDQKIISETNKASGNVDIAEAKGSPQQDNIRNFQLQISKEQKNENSSLVSTKNGQRKSSDNSSLLNKSSPFYPASDKAERLRSPGKIIFFKRSITLSDNESDTIKSEVTNSVSEEIPELMPTRNEVKINSKPTNMSKEERERESHSYDENTFESSEDSSTVKNKSSDSKHTSEPISHKSSLKSETETSEQASSEVVEDADDSSQTAQSITEHSSRSVDESSKGDSDVSGKSDSLNGESHTLKSQEDYSSSNANKKSDVSSRQYNFTDPSKGKKNSKIKNEINYRTPKTKAKEHKMDKKEKNVTIKKNKLKSGVTSLSSSATSVSSSTTSSSFYVKMKKKKYREKKRKLKKEKELTELIIKLLIKNLPLILQQSLGINSMAEIHEHQPRRFVCHNCGGYSVGYEVTQRRIDDALRQTVDLTRQFMESHKTLMEAQVSHHHSSYKYTTLENY